MHAKRGNTMTKNDKKARVWACLASVCFMIAVLSFTGVILARDTTGRLIFGFAWSFIGLSWFGRYLLDKKRPEEDAETE